MNDFGEFLYNLRKEKGITQAELAQMLGVTNKAVSKWETGEAMPETSQLLPISRIFGVSVDELLAGKRCEQHDKTENSESNEKIDEHVFSRGKDDKKKTLLSAIKGTLCSIIVFGGLLAYFILGIAFGLWHPYWVIIPTCALFSGMIGCVFDLFDAKKFTRGKNAFAGSICGIIMLLCIAVYLLLGAFLNLWHPLWVIVVAGALLCAIIPLIIDIINYRK